MKTRDQLCLYYSWCVNFPAKNTLDIYHYNSRNMERGSGMAKEMLISERESNTMTL